MRPFSPPSARLLVHAAGLLLVVAGIATWGRLLTPSAPQVRTAPAQAVVVDPTADALAAWFGPGEVRANIAVKGLIKGTDQGGVAVLSVNDGAPQSYRVGDTLGRALTLAGIEADAVTVDKAGTSLRIAAPVLPTAPGIVRAVP